MFSIQHESAKLHALRAKNMLTCLTYLHAHVPMCLACSCVLRAYMLMCQRALRAYVLMCQRALLAYVPMYLACLCLTCQRALRAYLLSCQCALHAYVLMCQRASFEATIFIFTAIVAEVVHTVDNV